MKTRDVVIGLIVFIILISGALIIRNNRNTPKSTLPLPTPNFQNVESKFPSLSVPSNADRINLNNVSGSTGMGEAFRTYQSGKFSLTIMVDLPSPNGEMWGMPTSHLYLPED